MEIILAIVVASAVIFFGALISMGNERHKRAIDGLREQIVLWAMQDLRIKRESLARNVHVEDPLGWLTRLTAKALGRNVDLQVLEALENPQVLICSTRDGGEKVIFTPLSPREIRVMKQSKHSPLSQYANQNPLLSLPKDVTASECSILNHGMLFDLELPLAWKGLTGQTVEQMDRIWIYTFTRL